MYVYARQFVPARFPCKINIYEKFCDILLFVAILFLFIIIISRNIAFYTYTYMCTIEIFDIENIYGLILVQKSHTINYIEHG